MRTRIDDITEAGEVAFEIVDFDVTQRTWGCVYKSLT